MALGVALAADIAGPRQLCQHLRKAHRQLPFQPAWLLRLLLSLAGPPPLAPLRLRCLRLRRRLLPRLDRRRIPRDVLHQMRRFGFAAFGFGAGFSRASIAVASREMCSTRWPSIVRAISVSCRRLARRLSANSEKARENVASLGSRPAPLQPHSRHSLPSTSRRSISARVVGMSNTALAMKARASAARSSSGRPTWPRK